MVFADVIYCDNQEAIDTVETTNYTYGLFATHDALDGVFRTTWIFVVSANNLTVEDGFFDIENFQIVRRHLFYGVDR